MSQPPTKQPRPVNFAPLAILPKRAVELAKEVGRHLLHRPVVGVAAAARTSENQWLLIRRADTGTWALPGGTLEWGETLQTALERELEEEAGVHSVRYDRMVGVFSEPERDPRFHAVTVCVLATIELPTSPPRNPLEIREVRLFDDDDLPDELAMGMTDMLAAARRDAPPIFE